MAKMPAVEAVCGGAVDSVAPFAPKWKPSKSLTLRMHRPSPFSVRATQLSDDKDKDKDKASKQLGMFSLRKKIEAAVDRAELLAPMALEHEEARQIEQEEMIRGHDLWNNVHHSSDLLVKLANSTKVVESLKDLTYKAEEAKLITELVDLDAINYGFFRQAYTASLDVSKLLDAYEMSKLLRGPFDNEGACVKIEARTADFQSEIWVEKLVKMYTKWAEKQGFKGRIVEKCVLADGGIKSIEIEFEFKYAYGYLLGERGVHSMIGSFQGTSAPHMVTLAAVDVIPLFLENSPDLLIDDEDIEISSHSSREKKNHVECTVSIHHLPTGLRVQSSGERSCFANKMMAINRLKAKLLVIMRELGLSDVKSIGRDDIGGVWEEQTRRYVFHPNKIVQDVKTEVSSFIHVCEGDAVTKLTNEKIPNFNVPIYLQNKTQIGKVDDVFGSINESFFSIKMVEGIVATSYSPGENCGRFFPQPKGQFQASARGGGGGRGGGRGGRSAPRGGRGDGFRGARSRG